MVLEVLELGFSAAISIQPAAEDKPRVQKVLGRRSQFCLDFRTTTELQAHYFLATRSNDYSSHTELR